MKRFYCACGNEVFFDNAFCNACGDSLGFVPERQAFINPFIQPGYRLCEHYHDLDCNWLVAENETNAQCCACRLTRTIPDLSVNNNLARWAKLEATKRRALYMLLRLGLEIPDRSPTESRLLFDFLEDQRSNANAGLDFVYSGHANGVITLNAAEADDSYLSAAQALMNEAYRTLLGHFRHELGHFYCMSVLEDASELKAFRQTFGDERLEYAGALEEFYNRGARDDWQTDYISAYASAHPLEDWAETWAHYLHISETLETAYHFGLITSDIYHAPFNDWLSAWMHFSVVLNALNRSMGTSDPYPFVITENVRQKLYFIDCKVKGGNLPC